MSARWPAIRELPALDDGGVLISAVGGLRPNVFCLYDLHGNVRELCRERFVDHAGRAHMRVVRGGCTMDGPFLVRSAYREAQLLEVQEGMFGVRVVER